MGMLLRKDIVSLPEQHMLSSVIYLYLNSFFVYLMTVFQKRVACTKFDIYVFIIRCLGKIVVLYLLWISSLQCVVLLYNVYSLLFVLQNYINLHISLLTSDYWYNLWYVLLFGQLSHHVLKYRTVYPLKYLSNTTLTV